MKPDIVRRYGHNPILTKAEIPYPVETVHNAAVVKHEGQYIMLFRSHLRTGRSIIGLARSPDGFHFTADPEPFMLRMSLAQLQVGGTGRFILRHFLGCVRCFFSSENGGESPEVPMTFRKCFSVSNQAEAAHRSTMAPSRHRVTLFVRF